MNKASSCASILGLFTACGLLSLLCTTTFPPDSTVKLREETLMIPTYAVGEPEKNPIFYFGRAYQGARGPVYPYPFLDVLTDRRMDRTYKALYLENEYVRFCLLPEIGGRIFEAVDKTNGYNFFYRQHVIKPALIGMLGAWISGGVEWNIPHHHRATSFLPVNWTMTENPDGSKTAWVGEIELRQRMKWAVGLTLRPGSSVLEVDYRIANRTPYAQSILCWANAAVHANENYQVIFPPGTRLATFHGKNQFSHWPISHEVYNGVDYTRGVDVSWWKNHPAPTSFFAFESAEDFFAGYDHGRRAGVVFVGDHGASPGKKLWTWGTGSEGKRWERILTDTDGPYLELMFGSFSDNQPDYSWLQPYEVKTFKQYWYPLREMGSVTQANARAACGVEFRPGSKAVISLNVTSVRRGARLCLTIGQPGPAPGRDAPQLDSGGQFRLGSGSKEAEKVVFEETVDIGPERPYFRVVSWPRDIHPGSLHLYFYSAEGEELISSHPATSAEPPLPQPVTPPLAPQDMKTNEELYLAGLRLEQFHNPSLDPDAYYEEILKRDPDDSRANTALGRLSILRGRREEAERFLRRAVGRLTANYTRPKDGEPLYYLGLAQRAQGKGREAFETFGRAAWSLAWSAASWLQMAELEAGQGHLKRALELAEQSLALNGKNAQASDLKTALLRRLGRLDEAGMTALAGLAQDPLDLWAANELMLIAAAQGNTQEAHARQDWLRSKMEKRDPEELELAADYARCGLYEEAVAVLGQPAGNKPRQAADPMVYYDAAFYSHKMGREEEARKFLELAAMAAPDYGFPYRLESIDVLRWAEEENPRDARAPYYLGNLLFDRQPAKAVEEWEKSRALDGTLATVHRNLGLAYSRTGNDLARAIGCLEKAVACDPRDSRLYGEIDELYDLAGEAPEKRLKMLSEHHEVVALRDDALSREITLLVEVGRYDRAIELLQTHHFHVWEGGGNVHDIYTDAHLWRGQRFLAEHEYREALADFLAALEYPENLEVGRPASGGRSPEAYYWIGVVQKVLGDKGQAKRAFEQSVRVSQAPSELAYYQGLSWQELGQAGRAAETFDALIHRAQAGLEEKKAAMDFFAKFGERESAQRRLAGFHYLLGLGWRGKGREADARSEFTQALVLYPRYFRVQRQLAALR